MSNDAAVATTLPVDHGHRLYVEQAGDPCGVPVVWLHGGPGSGFSASNWALFDRSIHRGVLFDQRASGRSRPYAAEEGVPWHSIDLDHHVRDIEAVRERLGIDRWVVGGASWGSVLAAAYAQRHPDRVRGVLLAAVSTGTRADIDHLTDQGYRYLPGAWQEFRDFVPERLAGLRLVEAYRTLVMDPDPSVNAPAARAWCRWEDAHADVSRGPSGAGFTDERYRDPRFRLAFARQVTHCWAHDLWLAPDELVVNAQNMGEVPCVLVHGASDASSPLESVVRLRDAWPGSRLHVVEGEAHGGVRIWACVARALHDLSA